ncbi:MAG: type II secretion system protein [bacterium]
MFQRQIGNNPKMKQRGISVVEILVAIAVIVAVLVSFLTLISLSLDAQAKARQNVIAANLAQEALEAARSFRNNIVWDNNDPGDEYDGFGVLLVGFPYHLEISGDEEPKWKLVQGEEIIDIFSRKVIFEDVQRDGSDNIVASGGINDPNTKKASVFVSWLEKGRSREIKLSAYFTNWR